MLQVVGAITVTLEPDVEPEIEAVPEVELIDQAYVSLPAGALYTLEEPGHTLFAPVMEQAGFGFTTSVAVQLAVEVTPLLVVTNVSVYVPGRVAVTVTDWVLVALNVAPVAGEIDQL